MISLEIYAKKGTGTTFLHKEWDRSEILYQVRRLLFQFTEETRIVAFSLERLEISDPREPSLLSTLAEGAPQGTQEFSYCFTHSPGLIGEDFPHLLTIVSGYLNRRKELASDELRAAILELVDGLRESL